MLLEVAGPVRDISNKSRLMSSVVEMVVSMVAVQAVEKSAVEERGEGAGWRSEEDSSGAAAIDTCQERKVDGSIDAEAVE